MRVAHILRKCDPTAWGGTETAMQRMFDGLSAQGVESVIYCPRLGHDSEDPLMKAGHRVQRFNAFVPVLGIDRERRRQLVSVGGNLMSFDLVHSLWKESNIDVIHAHTLGRLGGIGLTIAKKKGIPFVVTIHGGVLDLPASLKESFNARPEGGWEWGRFFGWIFQSHRLFADAHAIVTCNQSEADLLKERYPDKHIVVQRHAVPIEYFSTDQKRSVVDRFPDLQGREVILCLGRIDPVKNQLWLIRQCPELFRRNPNSVLILAGPCTDDTYGAEVDSAIRELGLQERVKLTGALRPEDPLLAGLLQSANLLVLPSLSETFGLVILEAWAAGTPVLCSKTSGARALIEHGENGWLFNLEDPEGFQELVSLALGNPGVSREMAARGTALVRENFSLSTVAGQLRSIYEGAKGAHACAT